VVTSRRLSALAAAFLAAAIAAVAVSARTGSTGASSLAALRICKAGGPPQPAAQFRYVILQAARYRDIAAIKRRNPATKVLAYKDMASTQDNVPGSSDLQSGVSYAYANRYHPEWFLKDTAGRRVNWADWPHNWMMDIGSRSYQRTWARNVARDLRRRGWDGVFLDGISRTMQYPWYLNGRVLAKYPGPNDYARATTRFLRHAGPVLRHGHLVVGNINDATVPLWRRWLRYLSGTSKEWWTKADVRRGVGAITGAEWAYQMQLLREAQARRKIFIAIAYGPVDDIPAIDYARASFLLFARGRRTAFSYAPPCGTEPSSSRWREDLGDPRGAAVKNGPVWRRVFAGGIALVNPSSSLSTTVPLGGTYINRSGAPVTSALLPPHTGVTLRRPTS
jgi:Hypothetical glycosyl hydrolase family 15